MTGPKHVAKKQLAVSRWNALTHLLRAPLVVEVWHAMPDGLGAYAAAITGLSSPDPSSALRPSV